MPLSVAFLWHMHQPYYKDDASGRYILPWVRLHAIKGYYDMIDLLRDFPGMKATFNLVPSLLKQLLEYADGSATDPALELSRVPAADLTPEQKGEMLFSFFMANWDTMIKPLPRFWELLRKRGFSVHRRTMAELTDLFSAQDYRDLQALFNLAWFGYRARKNFQEVDAYVQKGRGYTEGDIEGILQLQTRVIRQVIPSYQRAAQAGQVELTTSAFYHPILPLVYDTDAARRCMGWAALPKRFYHPEDAEDQIRKGLEFFEGIFGFKPKGFWPSEGSVSPELVPLFHSAGVRWIASDEQILFQSIHTRDRAKALFKPYSAVHGESAVDIVFRDRGLSDLIGFTYAKNDPVASAGDFVHHLHKTRMATGPDSGLVSVILDGENAWEHYAGGGERFLSCLYECLLKEPDLEPVTFGTYLERHTEREKLTSLFTGSWIHHDFDIWIGSEEENTAWDYLGKTRSFVHDLPDISPDVRRCMMEQIYIAEGSDWFWWYGDDFSSENDVEFDQLFRGHLASCYKLAGQDVPEFLLHPIMGIKTTPEIEKPVGFVKVDIDGKNTHFYEWHEAGTYRVSQDSAMHRLQRYIKQIFFGFDLSNLSIRVDPCKLTEAQDFEDIQLNMYLTAPAHYKIVVPRAFRAGRGKELILCTSDDGMHFTESARVGSAAFEDIIEYTIPFEKVNLKSGDDVRFTITVSRKDLVLERHPDFGFLHFNVPSKDFEADMWSV